MRLGFNSNGYEARSWFSCIAAIVALLPIFMIQKPANATWFDSATGQPVHVTPRGSGNAPDDNSATIHDLDGHSKSLYWDQACNTWRDSRTAQEVHVTPRGSGNAPDDNSATIHDLDGHSKSLYWVACPPPQTALSNGLYLGGELAKNWGRVRSTETLAATGDVTNQFTDSGDPIGGGIVAGYNFAPWNNNWIISPFASFDWLRLTINHTFPGGTYLGTTTNWIANLGAKAGYMVAPNWQVYGLAGAAWLNESLNINFPAGFSTKNTTTPGFTLGLGTEYHPSTWQVAGHPISLFAQYQHTWYANANFTTPTPASPLFNYAFSRQDDTIKFGVNVHL
jgi:opacity protein-like surface antigen